MVNRSGTTASALSHTRSGSFSSGRAASDFISPLHNITFNQDRSCFAVAMNNGYRIFSTDPLKEIHRRDFDDGGLYMVGMLKRSNLLAIVGGKVSKFSSNKVILFDEKLGKIQTELEFRSDVKKVILYDEKILISLKNRIYIYTLEKKPKQIHIFETMENPSGLFAFENETLAYPATQEGQVCIMGLVTDSNGSGQRSIIAAHKSSIASLALNRQGTLLATASEKGTLLRVFDVKSGRLMYELRRGVERAEIYDICFSEDSSRICVSSDKGTVHIFALNALPSTIDGVDLNLVNPSCETNKQSGLAFMKDLLPKYFASQWSLAQCRVSDSKSIVCFGADPSIIYVITVDGHFYRFRTDPLRGSDCVKEFFVKYLSIND